MKAVSAIALILALAALGAAIFVGYRAEERLELGPKSRVETVSREDVKALSSDLEALNGKLAALEERLAKLSAPPDAGEVPAASIVPLLRHMDPGVRRAAVDILKGLRDPGAVPALQQTAVKDVDPSVRMAAFRAMGSFGGDEVRKFLLETLKGAGSDVSAQAVEQLGQVGRPEDFDAVAAVFDREVASLKAKGSREAYLPASVRLPLKVMVDLAPAKSLSRVLVAVELSPSDYNTRAYLSRVVTTENVMELVQAVQEMPVSATGGHGSSSNSLHHAALMALRKTKDKRALPYIVKLLEGGDSALRAAAAAAIGEVGGQEACEHLEKALVKALEEAEKSTTYTSGPAMSLIDALRSTRDSRACAPLVKALGSKHSQLAYYAASGLIYCVDPAQGDAIFKVWKETTDSRLKGALANTLRYKRDYGYVWDEADKTFKKAAAAENRTLF